MESRESQPLGANLIERARAGEHGAFDALFARYAPLVAEEARRHDLDSAAGDVIQETFLRVYQRLGESAGTRQVRALAAYRCVPDLPSRGARPISDAASSDRPPRARGTAG